MSLVLGFVVLLLGPALVEAPLPGPATASIERFTAAAALRGLDVGLSVRCTSDHTLWGAHRSDVRMNPASGAKLLTTAAALALLSPEHTVATRVLGRLDGDVLRDVVVVAGADPSLTQADLGRLAALVQAAGARRIEGGITFDLSYFAGPTTPPAYDTKHSDAGYRPEVPAFAIGSGAFFATVRPGKRLGDPLRVTTSLVSASLHVDNSATTSAGKAIDRLVIEARGGPDGVTRLVVSGSLGKDAPPQGMKKRLADPALIAAEQLVRALEKSGVAVAGPLLLVRDKAVSQSGRSELARITSDPLAADIKETNTLSNNFMAETIFKQLGAEAGVATWERAAERTAAALVGLGVEPEGFAIVNGSGLYDGTKVSADAMTDLLASLAGDSPSARHFRESLAVAGVSGTLKGRLKKLGGKLRAKTGTLDNALSLSGYLPAERCLLAFSVLVNGDIGARAAAVNRRIDQLVLELAGL